MKVAIFEPRARLCGVTAACFHLVEGFRELGHDCDVVSFTKSGRTRRAGTARPGWYWWPEEPTVTKKWVDAGDVLSSYDLVILNEPKNGTEDRLALKESREPDYVNALRASTSPWLTMLYAPQYDPKRAPFLEQTLTAGKNTGIVIEFQPHAIESAEGGFDGHVRLVQPWPWLPYKLRDPSPRPGRQLAISVSGRCTPNKGHITLAWHADRFPPGWVTRVRGAEAGGMGAAVSYIMWDGLNNAGWKGWRDGQGPAHPRFTPNEQNNLGDKIAGWKYWLEKDGHVLEYTGPYDDAVATLAQDAVVCGLTNLEFSAHVEYSILEAMDAGCAIVLPQSAIEVTPGDWRVHPIAGYERALTQNSKGEPRFDRWTPGMSEVLVGAVQSACSAVEQGAHDPEHNRRVIAGQHDPKFLAQRMLELVGGG